MISSFLHTFPISWSRRKQIARRTYFFTALLNTCITQPDAAASVMGQNEYDVPADRDTACLDGETGILIFTIPAEFYGLACHHTYSIWQIGEVLKVGVLLANGLEQAPLLDIHREIDTLWYGVTPTVIDKGQSTLYEWAFAIPDLYSSWSEQEQYVLGMKHCKQRILRIIHDYAKIKMDDALD